MNRVRVMIFCLTLSLGLILGIGCTKKTVKVTDPVCGMQIDQDKALIHVHEGMTHYFCSQTCLDKFISSAVQK